MPPRKPKTELEKAHTRAAKGKGVPGLKAATKSLPKRKPVDTSSPELKAAQAKVAKTPVKKSKPAASRSPQGINPSIYPDGKVPKGKTIKRVVGKAAPKSKEADPPRLFPKSK